MRTLRLGLTALVGAGLFFGASQPAKQAPKLLHIPLSVQAEEGAAPLAQADVTASTRKGKLRVVRLMTPKDDLMLLTVFDVTGDASFVDPAKHALEEKIRSLNPSTYVGLLRAQDQLQVLVDPTGDREKIAAEIESLPVTGKSALLTTVQAAAQLADGVLTKSNVRVALLYITDSNVYNYREDFTNPVINSSDSRDLSRRFPEGLVMERISKIAENIETLQAPLFILHLRYQTDQLNEAYQSGLTKLAAATGGSAVFCRSETEIPEAVANIIDTISDQYLLTVQLPSRTPQQLQVEIDGKGRQLSYRNKFGVR